MRTLFFLILATNLSYSQISGEVKDINGEPIPFANIILHAAQDSLFVAGTSTDEQGKFIINPSEYGEFFLKISSLGYNDIATNLFIVNALNSTIKVPEVILEEEASTLSEVTVSAKKNWVQTTLTGKIINIQSSLMTKGSNALQVLERLPGVITDRRNNQFSLNGQSGVTVLFNGRNVQLPMEEIMALLENTIADNIEKIELITSPTAQYDADGGAGIINIVFKKNENEGTKINFSTLVGYGYREKGAINLGILQGFKKLNLYTSYSFLHDVSRSGYRGEGTAGSTFILGEAFNTFYGFGKRFQNTNNLNLNIDYQLTSKATLGGEFLLTSSAPHNVVDIGGTYELVNNEFIGLAAVSDGLTTQKNIISSVYFKQKISETSLLNLDFNFINYTNDSPTIINSTYFDRQQDEITPQNPIFTLGNRGESLSSIQVGVLKADFSTQINTNINAEFGAKASYAENLNDSKVEQKINDTWEIDPRSQSSIQSQEYIAAAYSQFRFLLTAKSNLHLGLRYEYWQREINTYNDAFTIAQFFPSVLFAHQINSKSNFNLTYTRRISRPAYTDLVSNLFYNDPTFVFSGNPLLKPTLSDVLKADFTTGGLNIGLSFQYDLHPILRYQITANETNDIGISSPQNLDYQKSINLFLSYPFQPAKWWNVSLSSTTSLRKYRVSYSLNPAEKSFVFQNFNFSQQIQLPQNIELELSGWYNLPFFEGTNSIKGFGILNVGISKQLRKENGTFQLSFPDVLQSFSVHTHIGGMTPIAFNINTVSNWQDETALYRVVKLTYSRTFGRNSLNRTYQAENEERGRIN